MIADNLFDAMREHGFLIESFPVYGTVTRFATSKVKEKTGWVYPFDDGKGASFGDWITGEKHDWFLGGETEKLTDEQKMQRDEQRWIARTKAENERSSEYKRAAIEAQTIWENALPCDKHAYFDKKGIAPVGNFRIDADNRLIVPVYDKDQIIQSLQFITHDGNKQFLTGGKIKGGCFVIGQIEIGKDALLCEGLATGYSVNLATDLPVIVAFSASNLSAVYESFKPHCNIKIAADNDKSGAGIKGAQKCEGAHIFVPTEVGMDFNDLHQQKGIDALRDVFNTRPETDFLCFSDMMKGIIKPEWILKSILSRQSINILFGESGAGKSLFALDWAYSISRGQDWEFSKCKNKGDVIYIAGEGQMGLAMRMQAIMQKYDGTHNERIHFSKKSFDFYKEDEVNDVIRQVDLIYDKGVKPVAIFVDTLARNFTGDENKASDVAIYVKGIEYLCKKYNCAVVTVHHSGHGDKDRVRGSSALKGAHDGEFCVTKDNDHTSTISCTKLKDGKKFAPRQFVIKEVDLIGDVFYDEDDDAPLTSVHLEFLGFGAEKTKNKGLSTLHAKALDALKKVFDDGNVIVNDDGVGGLVCLKSNDPTLKMVTTEKWKEYAKPKLKSESDKQLKEQISGARKALKDAGFIDFDGCHNWLV
jgi:phage/plasmid primase-like uncharacterized protein